MSGADAKPPTIYDVARVAGVSHQTVSRLLKGGSGIRPANRERIEAALRELGYQPNLAARALATHRPHRIAALVYELFESGPSRTLQGVTDAARDAGYQVDIVSLARDDDSSLAEAVDALSGQHIAGVVSLAPTQRLLELVEAATLRVPVVSDLDVTPSDVNAAGVSLVMEHLRSLGHRRFFHVSGPVDWLSTERRRTAYDAEIARGGLVSVGAEEGDWSATSGYEIGMRIPADGPTAIVVANDTMALGVLSALAGRGIDVPGRMSVAGFDDVPEARFYAPPLTTVRVDFHRQGRMALARLLARIDGADAAPAEAPAASAPLVVRASTGPAPRAA